MNSFNKFNNHNNKHFNNSNDILDQVVELLKIRPAEDILDALSISHKSYRGGDVIRGKCPDHFLLTGRYPSGDTDWVIDVNTGMTFCHTEKRGSNILWIAKRLKGFKTDEETLEFLLDGRDIKTRFQRFISGEKRRGFNIQNTSRKIEKKDESTKELELFNKRIDVANRLIEKGFISDETIKFFENDGISYETIKKFNIVSFTNGFSKYRCLIPFYDHINLNKLVGYVAVNTLTKHNYVLNMGRTFFKMQNISDGLTVIKTYRRLIHDYKKALYLKGSLMREHLFGLNNIIRDGKLKDKIYLVEGERDAIKMQQEGFPCVGTHGSDISLEQLDILHGVGVKKIYFIYDGDEAGRTGAIKSIDLALERGFRAFDICPGEKDPKKYNRNEMLELIKSQIDEDCEWSGLINVNKIKEFK